MQPASTLHRFRRYTDQADYLAATGNAPRPFDKTKPPKHWEDNTLVGIAPDALVQYDRLPRPGEALVIRSFTLSAGDASHVNIEGVTHYPAYVIQPTSAMIFMPGQEPQGINPIYLSTLPDANRIKNEIGGESVVIDNTWGGGVDIEYGNEQRRVFVIIRGSARLNAGLLIANQYAHGIGSPGHWDKSLVEPAWITEIQQPGDTSNMLPEVDEPINSLPAGSILVRAGVFQTLMIRTAEEQPQTGAGGTALPDDFNVRFSRIEAMMTDISERLKKLGV